jgi:hypothetical protein
VISAGYAKLRPDLMQALLARMPLASRPGDCSQHQDVMSTRGSDFDDFCRFGGAVGLELLKRWSSMRISKDRRRATESNKSRRPKRLIIGRWQLLSVHRFRIRRRICPGS